MRVHAPFFRSRDFFALNFYNGVYATPLASAQGQKQVPAPNFWQQDLGLATGGVNPYTGEMLGLQVRDE
jgi:hypothetical protein